MNYRGSEIVFNGVGIITYSYGFVGDKIRSYTAPLVRLFTGETDNHGALYVNINGVIHHVESAEDGVVRFFLEDTLDRKKAKIGVYEYTGNKLPEEVLGEALKYLHHKYDTPALFHQLFYRITGFIAFCVNNFIGRRKYKGIWLGKRGEEAKKKMGCYELIYTAFGFDNHEYASGSEFHKRSDFKPVFIES